MQLLDLCWAKNKDNVRVLNECTMRESGPLDRLVVIQVEVQGTSPVEQVDSYRSKQQSAQESRIDVRVEDPGVEAQVGSLSPHKSRHRCTNSQHRS